MLLVLKHNLLLIYISNMVKFLKLSYIGEVEVILELLSFKTINKKKLNSISLLPFSPAFFDLKLLLLVIYYLYQPG